MLKALWFPSSDILCVQSDIWFKATSEFVIFYGWGFWDKVLSFFKKKDIWSEPCWLIFAISFWRESKSLQKEESPPPPLTGASASSARRMNDLGFVSLKQLWITRPPYIFQKGLMLSATQPVVHTPHIWPAVCKSISSWFFPPRSYQHSFFLLQQASWQLGLDDMTEISYHVFFYIIEAMIVFHLLKQLTGKICATLTYDCGFSLQYSLYMFSYSLQ